MTDKELQDWKNENLTLDLYKREFDLFKHEIKDFNAIWSKAKNIKDFANKLLNSKYYLTRLATYFIDKDTIIEKWVINKECLITYSDIGSVKIGNDEFTFYIPNGYGDGENKIIFIDFLELQEINHLFERRGNFKVKDKIYLYDYDLGNTPINVFNKGNYSVYSYNKIVIFCRIGD